MVSVFFFESQIEKDCIFLIFLYRDENKKKRKAAGEDGDEPETAEMTDGGPGTVELGIAEMSDGGPGTAELGIAKLSDGEPGTAEFGIAEMSDG
jgi:hypothetical protein